MELPNKHQRIQLKMTETLTEPTVCLADQLACRLSAFAVKQSIERQNTSKLKTRMSKALVVIGGLLTLASIAYAALSYPLFFYPPGNGRFNWGLNTLLATGFSILPLFAGLVILKTESTLVTRPLHTFTNGGFETQAMHTNFHDFLNWAKSTKPSLGFELSESRILPLPQTIWSSSDLAIIIFGTEGNRRSLFNADNYALSSLIIPAREWNKYTLEKANSKQLSSIEHVLHENDTNIAVTPCPKEEKPLSIRQQMKRPGTKWSPRFKLMCSDYKYFKRYMDLKLNINNIGSKYEPCHRLIVLLESNFDDLDLIFGDEPLSGKRLDKFEILDRKTKSALRVVGRKNITRYNQLKTMRWILLEKYIEESEIISNAELEKYDAAVRQFRDSNFKRRKDNN